VRQAGIKLLGKGKSRKKAGSHVVKNREEITWSRQKDCLARGTKNKSKWG